MSCKWYVTFGYIAQLYKYHQSAYNGEWVLSAVKVCKSWINLTTSPCIIVESCTVMFRLAIRQLVISEEVYVLTDHSMNSYGCYLRNARTSLIICCCRLLMRDGRHQLNILRRLGRDGMIAERYTQSKHAPDWFHYLEEDLHVTPSRK